MQERRKVEKSWLSVLFRQHCLEILIRLGGLRLGGNFEVGVRRAARVACSGIWNVDPVSRSQNLPDAYRLLAFGHTKRNVRQSLCL
jgi:hypothetical protein